MMPFCNTEEQAAYQVRPSQLLPENFWLRFRGRVRTFS